ncbi:hypothetical protein DPMN_012550 [Dreissena polymorpha]|uniref:Uncharacterized protein n=1 Tax=Dreissena polymorpha TaxID=45954 RepID=A0A9D4N784_DREPO|nr:hypothetical protein DPMN_012550 [Dreissena polymorpha]
MIDIEPGSESNTVEEFDDHFDQATGRAESNECVDVFMQMIKTRVLEVRKLR